MLGRDPFANPEPIIRRVYAYVAYRIGDGPDAEDVTSDVFERALRYRDRYDSRKGDVDAWLLGIARRCVAGFVKSRPLPVSDPPHDIAPRDLEAETIGRLALATALSNLSDYDRELIALRFGADLTARRIAQLMGARTNTIEVALHRALGRLREALAHQEVGEFAHHRQGAYRYERYERG